MVGKRDQPKICGFGNSASRGARRKRRGARFGFEVSGESTWRVFFWAREEEAGGMHMAVFFGVFGFELFLAREEARDGVIWLPGLNYFFAREVARGGFFFGDLEFGLVWHVRKHVTFFFGIPGVELFLARG
jgi:hypothetical protein